MSNPIGARQIHWHLHVSAMAELEAVLTANKAVIDPEIIDQCRYALFSGIQSASNLIFQEGWSPAMETYRASVMKLERLQEYWLTRHQITSEDPVLMFHSLEQMLLSTAKVKYLTEQLQIYIRFAGE